MKFYHQNKLVKSVFPSANFPYLLDTAIRQCLHEYISTCLNGRVPNILNCENKVIIILVCKGKCNYKLILKLTQLK